jgi:glutamine synthetase
MQTFDRQLQEVAGRARAERLAEAGVAAVALTWVDNVGLTRVKAVPAANLGEVAMWGVGMSTVHDVFCVDDSIVASRHIGGPVGDLRLHPDLRAITVLAAQPGWAWAPVDRWTQDGTPYPPDQRGFARRMVRRAEAAGLSLRMAFETEWYLAGPDGAPASDGPSYGMTGVVELSDYGRDLLTALAAQGVPVRQFHPEYARGQLELSVGPTDPVAAADRVVLVRETIRAVSRRHGLRASFAPVPVAGAVGNGMHLHFSVHSSATTEADPLFAGGDGPHGLTGAGESVLAAVLEHLDAVGALGAPSVSSHQRRVPQRWAGAYRCWGLENREAAVRFVRGVADGDANAELKCVDASANPYLVVGAVCAIAAHGAGDDGGGRLPPEVAVDPATLAPEAQPPRLPASVPDSMAALAADDLLAEALGPELLDAFVSVHRADWERCRDLTDDAIAEAVRWRY